MIDDVLKRKLVIHQRIPSQIVFDRALGFLYDAVIAVKLERMELVVNILIVAQQLDLLACHLEVSAEAHGLLLHPRRGLHEGAERKQPFANRLAVAMLDGRHRRYDWLKWHTRHHRHGWRSRKLEQSTVGRARINHWDTPIGATQPGDIHHRFPPFGYVYNDPQPIGKRAVELAREGPRGLLRHAKLHRHHRWDLGAHQRRCDRA